MPKKIGELKRELLGAGWYKDRQRGTSHAIYKHPLLPGDVVELSAHRDGQDAQRYQERDVREAVERAEEAKRRQP